VPRESLDAPEDLSKQALCQVAFGKLEDEVPRMADEAPAGLEQPLLEARQGPALDGDRQDEPAQQIAEVVGDMCPSSLCGRPPRMSSNRKEFVLPMAT
jgi:hypothetical protein